MMADASERLASADSDTRSEHVGPSQSKGTDPWPQKCITEGRQKEEALHFLVLEVKKKNGTDNFIILVIGMEYSENGLWTL